MSWNGFLASWESFPVSPGVFREAEWHLRYRGKASRRRVGLPRIAERTPGNAERFPGTSERLFDIRKRLPDIGKRSFAIKGRGQWVGRLGMVIPPVGAGHAL